MNRPAKFCCRCLFSHLHENTHCASQLFVKLARSITMNGGKLEHRAGHVFVTMHATSPLHIWRRAKCRVRVPRCAPAHWWVEDDRTHPLKREKSLQTMCFVCKNEKKKGYLMRQISTLKVARK
uniref:Uncharacterized protein n=1 Tax=Rhipicephalus zambeziensis TaxID=60191 RepID=A0A224Y5V9_9ACAR